MQAKITSAHFYDLNPTAKHATGDVWAGLPALGLLGTSSLRGVVITPACDLAQSKVETITYLPILPLRSYFSLHSALPTIRKAIEGQLKACSLEGLITWPAGYDIPSLATLDAAEELLKEREVELAEQPKLQVNVRRARAGVRLSKLIISSEVTEANSADIEEIFGKNEWQEMKHKLISNAKPDMHFLPADGQVQEWSGVYKHSLVLFRYPITVPVQILDAAQDLSLHNWEHHCNEASASILLAAAFKAERPMKKIRIKSEFISDLLTRYVSLYNRLGSPDFTPDSVHQLATEIDQTK